MKRQGRVPDASPAASRRARMIPLPPLADLFGGKPGTVLPLTMMKRRLMTFAAAALLVASCTKPPPPPPPPTPKPRPAPKPVPTPHPAHAARETAIRLYPDLAKKDSTFNRAFREIYEERQNTDPASLAAVDWPLVIAQRTATMLEVSRHSPTPAPRPPAPVVVATPAPVKESNPLDRGAYNERRDVARPPVILDRSGNRVPMRR